LAFVGVQNKNTKATRKTVPGFAASCHALQGKSRCHQGNALIDLFVIYIAFHPHPIPIPIHNDAPPPARPRHHCRSAVELELLESPKKSGAGDKPRRELFMDQMSDMRTRNWRYFPSTNII
jgi:hypothetical protein